MTKDRWIELLEKVRAELEAQQPLQGTLQRGRDRWRYLIRTQDGRVERRYVRQADREIYQRRVRLGQALKFINKALELLNGE